MTLDRLLRVVMLRLKSIVRRNDLDRDLAEEVQYHLEQRTEENLRSGMTPAAARAAALRAFGGVAYHTEVARDARGTRALEDVV